MLAEFEYYSIGKIITDTHNPSISAAKFNHWLEIEQLFVQAFVTALPARIYEDVKVKASLQDKWLAILKNYTHTNLGKIIMNLLCWIW